MKILSASPGRRALTLAEVALCVCDFLERLYGFCFVLVEETVEEDGEDTLRV